jgi:hypothetical protein
VGGELTPSADGIDTSTSPGGAPRTSAIAALGLAPTVAGLSFVVLSIELLIARTSVFYINAGTSYVAIPMTLLGLAIGSLALHLRPGALERFRLERAIAWVAATAALACVGLFVLFSRFPIVHAYDAERLPLLLAKTLTFVGLFLVPLALAGRTMAAIFTLERRRIGQLYAADLVGAAVGAMATPLLLHFVDLPVVVTVALVVLGALVVRHAAGWRRWVALALAVALAPGALALMAAMERSYDFRAMNTSRLGRDVRQHDHRWNEYSRVAVLEFGDPGRRRHQIVHDNSESNVNVQAYVPGDRREPGGYFELTDVPFQLGRPVRDALVMFAGCGAQMIQINDYGRGRARVRGVELNPLVIRFGLRSETMRRYRIAEFLRLPNVELLAREGRSYLQQDRRRYDFIYAGSDAGTSLYRAGHSRKYLDTLEAMADYVDNLQPRGVLVFEMQPTIPKIQALRVLAERATGRPGPGFARSVVVLGRRRSLDPLAESNNLLYSPAGFSDEDVETLRRVMAKRFPMLYGPGYRGNRRELVELIEGPMPRPEDLVTDDRPFLNRIVWEGFTVRPTRAQLASAPYFRNWIRIASLLVVSALVVLLLVVAMAGSRGGGARPPPLIVAHLLLSGFAYMLCQIPFLGVLELFLGNPLVAMAVLLAVFLLMNGLGSFIFSRIGPRLDARLLCLAMPVVVLLTLLAVRASVGAFLGWPLVAKLCWALMLLAPLALGLGLFYPFAVSWLTSRGREQAVPVTFGLSTLSSVAGGTWALFAAVNFGYSGIVFQAVAVYAALAAIYAIAGKTGARLAA